MQGQVLFQIFPIFPLIFSLSSFVVLLAFLNPLPVWDALQDFFTACYNKLIDYPLMSLIKIHLLLSHKLWCCVWLDHNYQKEAVLYMICT